MNKKSLLAWLNVEQSNWEIILSKFDESLASMNGVCGNWSMKDVVKHLTGWNLKLVQNSREIVNNLPLTTPWPSSLRDESDINAWIVEQSKAKSWQEVVSDCNKTFTDMVEIISSLPENSSIETVTHNNRNYYFILVNNSKIQPGEFFDHYHDDHEKTINEWLQLQR